jgi:hypothetical protein
VIVLRTAAIFSAMLFMGDVSTEKGVRKTAPLILYPTPKD